MKITKFPNTKFNKNIELIKNFGEPTLIIDGLIESGYLLTNIWKLGLKNLLPKKFTPKKILLLGLGGGSNAILCSKFYPEAQITAVEVDSKMVEIANNYYNLKKVKNLSIVVADAEDYIAGLKSENYDLVLVDCFVGKYIPQKLQTIEFIKKLFNHSRFTLINRIWGNEHHLETVFFLRSLSKHFYYQITHTKTNIVVSLL